MTSKGVNTLRSVTGALIVILAMGLLILLESLTIDQWFEVGPATLINIVINFSIGYFGGGKFLRWWFCNENP